MAFPLSFVVATYVKVRLWPAHQLAGVARVAPYSSRRHSQDCLPDRQVKIAAGALHLGIFDQPATNEFFKNFYMRAIAVSSSSIMPRKREIL